MSERLKGFICFTAGPACRRTEPPRGTSKGAHGVEAKHTDQRQLDGRDRLANPRLDGLLLRAAIQKANFEHSVFPALIGEWCDPHHGWIRARDHQSAGAWCSVASNRG